MNKQVEHTAAAAQPARQEHAPQEHAPQSVEEAMAALSPQTLRNLRLARLAGIHALVWLLALGLFAAAQSWTLLGGPALATFLVLVTGVLAGLVTANVIHEWFHYLGARLSGGTYDIPRKAGLFVYDWHFDRNSTGQFFTMSIAGSVGSVVSLFLLWNVLPPLDLGAAAVFAGAFAGTIFAFVIEWPVLRRVRFGGEPLAELAKIDGAVLTTAFLSASLAGVVCLLLLAP